MGYGIYTIKETHFSHGIYGIHGRGIWVYMGSYTPSNRGF